MAVVGALCLAAFAAQAAAPPAATNAASAPFAATIQGEVAVDGLAVPGVTITITDPSSGQQYVTSTDERGAFQVRVAHPGTFEVATSMSAFAPNQASVTVPAKGGIIPPLTFKLAIAREPAPAAPTALASAAPEFRRGGRGGAGPRGGNRGGRANAGAPGQTANAGNAGGRGNFGGGNFGGRGGTVVAQNNDSYQSLNLSQTADLSGMADNSAAAANSGIAGMSDSAATNSAVVTGNMGTQDQRPMDAAGIRGFLAANGGAPAFLPSAGGRGGPGGFGGRGPGGFGGRGGFAGRGGFGGRGGFFFNRMANRLNQPHGNLSYNLSDSALNALPDTVTGRTTNVAPQAANQRYSASISTPLVIPHIFNDHGQTHLFINYDGTHNSSLRNVTALVPTVAERQGIFTGLTDRNGKPITLVNPSTGQPYPNNVIPNISPAAAALLAYVPEPTPGAAGQFNYSNTLSALSTNNNISIRINHSFSSANANGGGRGGFGGRGPFGRGGRNLNINVNFSSGQSANPGTFYPFVSGTTKNSGANIVVGYNQTIAGWINNISVNYNRSQVRTSNLYAGVTNVAAQAGITGVATDPLDWGIPGISFSTSGLTGISDTTPNYVRSSTWSISDRFIRRIGRQNIIFGGDYRWLLNAPERDQSPNGNFIFDGQYSGYDFADFLLGLPQQDSLRYGGGVFYFHQTEPDLFIQDNWQASGSFTVSAGLRWEYVSPYSEQYNRLTNLLVAPNFSGVTPVVAGSTGVPTTIIHPDYHNFRPSLGLAWKSFGGIIWRAGMGMAYNTGAYANMATALAYQTPFITSQTNLGGTSTPLSLTNGFNGPAASVNTYGVNPNYTIGYSTLWNVDAQRRLGQVYTLDLDYSGSKGTHLDQLRAPNRTPTGLLYPNLPVFLYDTTGGNSIYQGGTISLSRFLSQGVSVRASYTYSKMMDDASQIGGGGGAGGMIAQNDQNLRGEWALSNQNVTNNFNFTYEWQLPYGLNHRWGDNNNFMSSALGDWQLSGNLIMQSGQPFTPTVANAFSNAQGLQALGINVPLRPNATGQAVTLAQPTLTSYFNTAAFTAPAAGSYGNVGRNSIIGPGQVTLNMSLDKAFRMGEFNALDVRFDAQNLLNHPNWSGLGTQLNSPTFGNVTSFGAPRQITFTARFSF